VLRPEVSKTDPNIDMDRDLKEFIRGAIESVWALEVLLLLRRNPDLGWTEKALARELRSHDDLIRQVLAGFLVSGLAARHGDEHAYQPRSAALDELSGRLEQAYRERPVAVINVIAGKAGDVARRAQ